MWAVLTTSLLPLAAAAAVPAMPADVQVARGSSTNNGTHKAQVIVLGGGISGISAARSLVSDYNVTDIILIEARDELGGRAHTDTMTNKKGKSVVVERGCNWIQGPGKEVITALADKWGLETSVSNYTNTSWYEGLGVGADGRHGKWLDTAEQEEFMSGYDTFLDNAPSYADWRANNSLVDITVRAATSIMDWIPTSPLQWAYEYYNVDWLFAQTPSESSFANAFGQEAGNAGDEDNFVIDQRGYKYIFVQEAREIFGQNLEDPRLHLSTTVKTIDYSAAESGGDIVVTTTDGQTFSAPHVVSTFSVGVLQNQDVNFVPKLPDWKKEAIFTFAMTTYQKIFIMFDEQFWGPEQYMMYADPDQRGRYTVWQNINAPGFFPQGTTANLVMVTAIDDFARRNEKLTDDEVKEEVYQILKEMYGNDIPKPTDILVPRWTLDPLYRGTYSNWPIGATDQHHDNLGAPVGSGNTWLHFSGEAMSAELFGYVQGAWDEGLNAATTVAACLGGKCPTVDVFEAVTTCAQTATEFTRRDVGTKRKGMLARRGGRRNRK